MQKQVYITTPFASPLLLDSSSEYDDISAIRDFLSSKYSIPSEQLTFYLDSRILPNETLISGLSGFIQVRFGLSAGKGGFGSLLRGQAATKRKTTNFDASKDLKGRRIRNVENEKKLKEFLKKKQEEDEKVEKELLRFKEIEEKKNMLHYQMKLTQEYKNKLDDWERKMGKSISVGFSKLRSNEEDKEGFEIPQKKVCSELHQKIKNLYEKYPEEEKKELAVDNFQKNSDNGSNTLTIKEEEMLKTKEDLKPSEDRYPQIELNAIKSIADLEELGSEHLKSQLMKLGLKCGGSLRERAQRLFDIKTDPTNLFNPKYLAKPKK